jgi:hypothetical protein
MHDRAPKHSLQHSLGIMSELLRLLHLALRSLQGLLLRRQVLDDHVPSGFTLRHQHAGVLQGGGGLVQALVGGHQLHAGSGAALEGRALCLVLRGVELLQELFVFLNVCGEGCNVLCVVSWVFDIRCSIAQLISSSPLCTQTLFEKHSSCHSPPCCGTPHPSLATKQDVMSED